MNQLYRKHRYPTRFPIQMTTPTGRITAHVIDVNESGARISGMNKVRCGDKVFIQAVGKQYAAVVRWIKDERVGVSFTPALAPRDVDALRYAKKPMTPLRHTSMGLREMR